MPERKDVLDMMIGGTQKAGTTSLKAYLAQHPWIRTHPQVECSFFVDDAQYEGGLTFFYEKYFPFQRKSGERFIGKHATLYRSKKGLVRLKNEHPNTRLVLLLRDPVERAYSSYLHQKKMDQEPFSFSEILDHTLGSDEIQEERWRWRYNIYIGLGCYAHFLDRIFELFSRDRVSLFLSEEFEKEPAKVCRTLFEKLGISSDVNIDTERKENIASEPRSRSLAQLIKKFVHQDNAAKRTLKGILPPSVLAMGSRRIKEMNQKPVKKEGMKDEERERLLEFYAPWNKRLKDRFGLDLSPWQDATKNETGRG